MADKTKTSGTPAKTAKAVASRKADSKPASKGKAATQSVGRAKSRSKAKAESKAVKTRAAKVSPVSKDAKTSKTTTSKAAAPKVATTKAAAPEAKAAEAGRKKPGVPRGTKRGKFNKDGTVRRKPGPKPKTAGKVSVTAKSPAAVTPKTPAKARPAVKAKTTKAKVAKTNVAKPAKPKAPAKAASAAQAASRSAVKAPRKADAPKLAVTKAVAKPAPAPAPRTVKELHAYVEKISVKLSRADARSARNVKKLDTALAALAERNARDADNSRKGLIRRIDNVKSSLSALAAETRHNTRRDLEAALLAERPEQMAAILEKVEARIDAAGAEQSRSLSRLNQHLADMARAMDARLLAVESAQAQETESRRAAVDVLTGRIDAIESETARAITDIGERMVTLATGLREDIEAVKPADGQDLSNKLDSIAAQTEGQVEAMRIRLQGGVDAATRTAADADSRATEIARRQEAALAALTARIEGLEYALSNPAGVAAPVPESSAPVVPLHSGLMPAEGPSPAPLQLEPLTPLHEAPQAGVPEPRSVEPQASRDPSLPDHYPTEYVPPAPAEPAMEAPAPVMPLPGGAAALSVVPQPNLPQPGVQVQDIPMPDFPMPDFQAQALGTGISGDAGIPQPDFPQPSFDNVPMPNLSAPGAPVSAIPVPTTPALGPIADSDLPYTNPGYAETGARPGGFEGKKDTLLSRLKGRHLRVAGLAVGVALVSTWGIKNAIGDGGRIDQASVAPASTATPVFEDSASAGSAALDIPPIETIAPIGDTAELDVAMIDPASFEGQSLEAAVAAGNPVAQYQFGMMEIDRRNLENGVKHIRLAADQGLPAAEYRLAKLYEVGQGVPQNVTLAAQLSESAARRGHRIAMHDTGLFKAEGIGTGVPDTAGAVEWFGRAARMGVVDSQFNLGYLLDQGPQIGMPDDPAEAYKWFAIASRNGDQQAEAAMADMRERMTPDQIADAEARVAAFRVQPMDEAANGIFRDLPWTTPASPVVDAQRENVRMAQAMLNRLGFQAGPADGLMGPKTRDAIREYERLRDLPETGTVSTALLDALQGDVPA